MKRIGTEATEARTSISFVGTFCRRWLRPAAGLFDTYRPERHYMRGPGPRSRQMQHAADILL